MSTSDRTNPSNGRTARPAPAADGEGIAAAYRRARAVDPGGGPFTRSISGPLGSWLAAVAIGRRLHPSLVTLASLAVGAGTSLVVISAAADVRPWALPGCVALIGWQLAYVLDCADGQVARATGRTSEAGARLDVLCDYAVHCSIVCALLAVVAHRYPVPVALLALAAALWFVSTLTAVLKRPDSTTNHSFVRGRSPVAEVVRMAGDNGAVVFVVGGWLLVHPATVIVPVAGLTLVNACYLVATIGRDARASMRSPGVSG